MTTPANTGAIISPCGIYCYRLDREIGEGPAVTFVMCNPSKEDPHQDDPTIRRCRDFAQLWSMGRLIIVNLFACRVYTPVDIVLGVVEDPVGPENEQHFMQALKESQQVVCGWGDHGRFRHQYEVGLEWIKRAGHTPMALHLSNFGMPLSPIYVPTTTAPFPYTPPDRG